MTTTAHSGDVECRDALEALLQRHGPTTFFRELVTAATAVGLDAVRHTRSDSCREDWSRILAQLNALASSGEVSRRG